MTNEEFTSCCSDILRALSARSFETNIRSIDELEARSSAADDSKMVAISCADLRLDAALEARRPYGECLLLFQDLVGKGADAQTRLLKSIILLQQTTEKARAVVHVRAALDAAEGEPVHRSLIERGRDLIAALESDQFD